MWTPHPLRARCFALWELVVVLLTGLMRGPGPLKKLGRIRIRCPDTPLQNQLVFSTERILPGLVAECQPWAAQKARICAESSCWTSHICRPSSLVIVVPVGR